MGALSLRNVRQSVSRFLAPRKTTPTVPYTVACQKALDALASCPPPERFPSYPLSFVYRYRTGRWVAFSTRDQIEMDWGATLFFVSLVILFWIGVWLVHAF